MKKLPLTPPQKAHSALPTQKGQPPVPPPKKQQQVLKGQSLVGQVQSQVSGAQQPIRRVDPLLNHHPVPTKPSAPNPWPRDKPQGRPPSSRGPGVK